MFVLFVVGQRMLGLNDAGLSTRQKKKNMPSNENGRFFIEHRKYTVKPRNIKEVAA
jgi:hypothetical protein